MRLDLAASNEFSICIRHNADFGFFVFLVTKDSETRERRKYTQKTPEKKQRKKKNSILINEYLIHSNFIVAFHNL